MANRYPGRRARRSSLSRRARTERADPLTLDDLYRLRKDYEEWLPPAMDVVLEEAAWLAENEDDYEGAGDELDKLFDRKDDVFEKLNELAAKIEAGLAG